MLSKKSKAIGFIIMSAFGFAMMAAFVRLAGDLPFTQKTFFRNLVAVAVAAVVLCREKVGFKGEKGNLPLLIIRATCGTLGIFCNYYAIDHLVLADANILNKMSPFFAIIFSLILLKERASVFQYAAAADQPRGTAHQRGLRLSGYAVQTAGRGAARPHHRLL